MSLWAAFRARALDRAATNHPHAPPAKDVSKPIPRISKLVDTLMEPNSNNSAFPQVQMPEQVASADDNRFADGLVNEA
jgi:hypothetical protein